MDLSGKRILIVKPSSLGDVVHTLPVAHAVKRCFPTCHVGWIVQREFRGILDNDPAVDEVIPIFIPSTSDPGGRRGAFFRALSATMKTLVDLRRQTRADPYDLVLDLHASFRSGLLGMANPGGMRVGFADAKELNTLFQDHRLTTDPEEPHAVDKNLAFSRFLGCSTKPEDFIVISGPRERERVQAFLRDAGVDDGRPLVYANPAARWETKFWSIRAWAELADLLIRRAGAGVIFSGSPRDLPHIRRIEGKMKERPVTAAGKLSLAEAVALIRASDVYVGVDSGPMHIAAFVGTPVAALFGPTDPALVGPYGAGHCVIQNDDLDCLACRKRSCADRQCLEGITSATVFDSTVRLLGL